MKKGFTLIELLAVIVILAIIALIAVPIVIHIINDSKKSSEEQSVELYMDSVKKAIARKQLEESNFKPDTCTIKEDGNLLCNNIEVTIDMEGIKPNKGIIEVKDNKLSYKNLKLKETYFNRLATPVQDNNNNGKPDIGDKYTYKVNDIDTFNFYVLSFNEDDTVNLIMDRNICNDGTTNYTNLNNYCRYAWYAEENNNTYGPVTAMQELYEGTKDWTNVSTMKLNYIDESNDIVEEKGYTSLKISDGVAAIVGKPTTKVIIIGTSLKPIKARLPKYSEVNGVNCTGSAGSCPVWLMENIKYYNVSKDKYSMNNNSEVYQNINGYWLISSTIGYSNRAYVINYYGYVQGDSQTKSNNGIRPVITVPKSYLE